MVKATALIDINNFYASCEQFIDPSLIKKPLVVLSNNDGCIIARNAEARSLGIAMGTPYFKVWKKLEQLGVVVRSSNYSLYGDMSQRLMSTLEIHCEDIEIYSIDEAFVQILRPLNNNLLPWARFLRAQIYQHLGLVISIGIGNNKTHAKLSNHLAKSIPTQAGIFDSITVKDSDQWLDDIAIEKVWGIGSQLAKWCREHGITTARELRDMPSDKLRSKYGVVGIRLQNELKGEICLPLQFNRKDKKETCVSRSFGKPITTLYELRQAIATNTVRASEKLRHQGQYATVLTVFTQSSPFLPSFYRKHATRQLTIPSNDTFVLLKTALELTSNIFQPHCSLTKAGVKMQQLQRQNHLQHHLLIENNIQQQEKKERLIETIDKINSQYGAGTLKWAVCGLQTKWGMRRKHLSLASTTRIEAIPVVIA